MAEDIIMQIITQMSKAINELFTKFIDTVKIAKIIVSDSDIGNNIVTVGKKKTCLLMSFCGIVKGPKTNFVQDLDSIIYRVSS